MLGVRAPEIYTRSSIRRTNYNNARIKSCLTYNVQMSLILAANVLKV